MSKKHHLLLYGLLSLCVLLAVAYALEAERACKRSENALEELYQGALLMACAHLEEMNLTLDKALVSCDEGQSARLLGRVSRCAAQAQSELAMLPLAHAAGGKAEKLCNQLGDYCDALLARGEGALREADANTLASLRAQCDGLSRGLREALSRMRVGKLSLTAEGVYLADLDAAARPPENVADAIDYPTLLYDGPFSDVTSEEAPRGLPDFTIDAAQALQCAAEFLNAPPESLSLTQESGGAIPAYGVRAALPDGALLLAVTRQGGQVLWMFPEQGGFEARYGLEDARRAAQDFLLAHGYGEMRLTFWQIYGGMATLSYAAVQEDVVLYPDLVKVQVRLDTLATVGLEARHYLTRHTVREGLTPALSRETAAGALSPRLTVERAQLCLIPLNAEEVLCWEFTGSYNGETYFVYIDAATGRQRDIQRLVVNEKGPEAG